MPFLSYLRPDYFSYKPPLIVNSTQRNDLQDNVIQTKIILVHENAIAYVACREWLYVCESRHIHMH